MSIFVGVDAGGTSTNVVVASEDEIVCEFVGASANVSVVGVEDSADTIALAIATALNGARASAVHVGAAGIGTDDLARELRGALETRLSDATIGVSDDTRIALRAAVRTGDGMVLLSGTGSIAYAEVGDRRFRSGGYGYLVGDEGSGFAIGSAALRFTLRTHDGRSPKNEFAVRIVTELEATDAQAILRKIYDDDRPVRRIAALAPIVLELANAGDRTAAKIVQAAALDLFELVKSLAITSGLLEREFSISFAGGLLKSNSLLTYLVETRIATELPDAHAIKNAPAPQFGALALARAALTNA